MKDIKDYVCTLEQAKKLKELGIKQNSLLWFSENEEKLMILKNIEKENLIKLTTINDNITVGSKYYFYSAFTSQELGELIENELKNELSYEMRISISNPICHFIMLSKNRDYRCIYTYESQARAEYLIYLLEKKDQRKDPRTIDFKNKIEQAKNGVTND